jgi:hypothetical protein
MIDCNDIRMILVATCASYDINDSLSLYCQPS